MKYVLILVPFLLLWLSNVAQEGNLLESNQKKMLLGGGLSYSSTKENDNYEYTSEKKGHLFKVEPKIAFYLGHKFLLGFQTGIAFLENAPIGLYTEKYGNKTDFRFNAKINSGKILNFAPFVRYQNTLTKNLYFYIENEYGFEFSEYELFRPSISSTPQEEIVRTFCGSLSAGLVLEVSRIIGIELQVVSTEYRANFINGGSKPLSSFETNFIFSNPNIGLLFYF